MRMMGEANELDYFGDLLLNTCGRDWRFADARCIPKLQAVQPVYDADPRRSKAYLYGRLGALRRDAHAVVVGYTEATARGVGVIPSC